jgi:hypothetical protein
MSYRLLDARRDVWRLIRSSSLRQLPGEKMDGTGSPLRERMIYNGTQLISQELAAMPGSESPTPTGRLLKQILSAIWPLALALAFFLAMSYFFPFRVRLDYGPDEGINLIKALLVSRGYPLYEEIWSDQPPLFTLMLSGWMKVFGFQVIPARFLVLFLSTILLWAAAEFLRRAWGAPHAVAGAILIVFLPYYPRLSVSVMVGLPSITFVVVSLLFLILWHQRRKYVWLILSAIFFSISIFIKIFTGFLAPIFLLGLLADGYRRYPRLREYKQMIKPAFLWGLTASLLSLAILLLFVGPANIPQLLQPHLEANEVSYFQQLTEEFSLNHFLYPARYLLALAVLGAAMAVLMRKWSAIYPLAWAASAYMLLSIQVPVWYHHQLLVTIPAAILAAGASGEVWMVAKRRIQGHSLPWAHLALSLVAAAGFIVAIKTLLPDISTRFKTHREAMIRTDEDFLADNPILIAMTQYAPETRWVVTDLPIYAFRANLLVPPELAVFTEKRVETGFLTEAQALDVIKAYQPEQILLGRFRYQRLDDYVAERYAPVVEKEGARLYVREGLSP